MGSLHKKWLLAAMLFAGPTVCAGQAQESGAAWKAGKIFVPASLTASGAACDSDIGGACIAGIKPGKHPVIVFLHGCGGPRKPKSLIDQNAIVVAPNSFADGSRCEADSAAIAKLVAKRFVDVYDAAAQVKAAPWADAAKLVLAGFSNGGQTAAVYPGDEFTARIIVAWTCTHPRRQELNGVSGNGPVLAVLGTNDEFYKKIKVTGDCGAALAKRPASRSVLIPGGGHEIIDHKDTRSAVTDFLKGLLN